MTHDELLAEIDFAIDDSKYNYDFNCFDGSHDFMLDALRAVVELHRPMDIGETLTVCRECFVMWENNPYPCPTIQAIEKVLAHSTES